MQPRHFVARDAHLQVIFSEMPSRAHPRDSSPDGVPCIISCGTTATVRSARAEGTKAVVGFGDGYFVYIGFEGATGGGGAAGEIAKVTHVFQPSARHSASNSKYALRFRYRWMFASQRRGERLVS
jgi:hypothetical protein